MNQLKSYIDILGTNQQYIFDVLQLLANLSIPILVVIMGHRYIALQDRKHRISKITKLLSLWIKYNNKTIESLKPEDKLDHFVKLNKLTWDLVLWIKDEDLLNSLMDQLIYKEPTNIKELLLQVRNTIQNKKYTKVKSENIPHFK